MFPLPVVLYNDSLLTIWTFWGSQTCKAIHYSGHIPWWNQECTISIKRLNESILYLWENCGGRCETITCGGEGSELFPASLFSSLSPCFVPQSSLIFLNIIALCHCPTQCILLSVSLCSAEAMGVRVLSSRSKGFLPARPGPEQKTAHCGREVI